MPYAINETETDVTLEPPQPANATIIWLHGMGADGYDFVPIVDELRLPQSLPVRFIFPHARPRPVTLNNGFVMRAWHDVEGFHRSAVEDEAGIRESQGVVGDYISKESARGIATHRVIVAGFSQGGAIALQTGLRYPQALGGIMALSTYLPLRASLATEASPTNKARPILMCHGSEDNVVPQQLGEMARDQLRSLGYQVEWHSYPMPHSVCVEEVAEMSRWLQGRLA